ncbi:MAG: hypothetical protein KDH91_10865, partial [Rhodoferax sp.]|nr:hypothetical protein [Rhodoferax sp.]
GWRFEIRDDGQGFDSTNGGHDETHVGMRIMRERAERIGGELEVHSSPGRGTSVILSLPAAPVSPPRSGTDATAANRAAVPA